MIKGGYVCVCEGKGEDLMARAGTDLGSLSCMDHCCVYGEIIVGSGD